MKLFKRGLLVAALSVSALAAMAGVASASHLPNGPYTATGTLTLNAGLGSTCSVTATGVINSAAHTGTVTSFSSTSCSGAASAISGSGTWTMSVNASDVVTISGVTGTATVLGTSCTFGPANGATTVTAAWNDPNEALVFNSSSLLEIKNACAFGLIPAGRDVTILGSLSL